MKIYENTHMSLKLDGSGSWTRLLFLRSITNTFTVGFEYPGFG